MDKNMIDGPQEGGVLNEVFYFFKIEYKNPPRHIQSTINIHNIFHPYQTYPANTSECTTTIYSSSSTITCNNTPQDQTNYLFIPPLSLITSKFILALTLIFKPSGDVWLPQYQCKISISCQERFRNQKTPPLSLNNDKQPKEIIVSKDMSLHTPKFVGNYN